MSDVLSVTQELKKNLVLTLAELLPSIEQGVTALVSQALVERQRDMAGLVAIKQLCSGCLSELGSFL